MAHPEIFGITGPSSLFKLICDVYSDYYRSPNERDFLFLCFGLHHLREWIHSTGNRRSGKEIENTPTADRTAPEQFYIDIYQLEEFQVVRNFNNSGKHGSVERNLHKTTIVNKPFTAGSPAGDALIQKHFQLDEKNSRAVFATLIATYRNWFEKQSNQKKQDV